MRLLVAAAALAVAGCSDMAESIATAPCLWVETAQAQLPPPHSEEEACWYVDPPDGLAVAPEGLTGCSAARWQDARVWPAGTKLRLWQRFTDERELHMEAESIACP